MAVSSCHCVNDRPSLLLLNVFKQTQESLIGCLQLFNQNILFSLNLMFAIILDVDLVFVSTKNDNNILILLK